jgi:hypothetical protein
MCNTPCVRNQCLQRDVRMPARVPHRRSLIAAWVRAQALSRRKRKRRPERAPGAVSGSPPRPRPPPRSSSGGALRALQVLLDSLYRLWQFHFVWLCFAPQVLPQAKSSDPRQEC